MRTKKDFRRNKVISALEEWVRNHKQPDKPLLYVGYDSYTPRQILADVKAKTEFGEDLLRYLISGSRAYKSLTKEVAKK